MTQKETTSIFDGSVDQPVRDTPHGTPSYAGKILPRSPRVGGYLHEDTETGGVCIIRQDQSFRSSWTVLRFDSIRSLDHWEKVACD